MAHPFEVRAEIDVAASPEDVWDAITTGRGLDAWFMGTSSVEPRLGGAVRTDLGGFSLEATITAWDPPHRFATTTPEGDDGALMAFEYVIEGRGGDRAHLRYVHSGFLAGDDWEQEYDGLKNGDPAYVFKLGEYLQYFRGRVATPIAAYGAAVERDRAFRVFGEALALSGEPQVGAMARFEAEGLPSFEGVVDYVSRDFLGVRTSDAMYRFIHGLGGAVVLGHHVFAEIDREAGERAWQAWVDRSFA